MNANESLLSHLRQREMSAQNSPLQSQSRTQMNTHAHTAQQSNTEPTLPQMAQLRAQSQQQSYTPPQLFCQVPPAHTPLNDQMHAHNTNTHTQVNDSHLQRNLLAGNDKQIELRAVIGSLWSDINKQQLSVANFNSFSQQRTTTQPHSYENTGDTYRSTAAMSDVQTSNGKPQYHAMSARGNMNASSHTGTLLTGNVPTNETNEYSMKNRPQQWTTTGGTFSPITGVLSADGFYIPVTSHTHQLPIGRDSANTLVSQMEQPLTDSAAQMQRAKYANNGQLNPTRAHIIGEESRNISLENNQKVANAEKKPRRKGGGQMRKDDPHIEGRSNANEASNLFDSSDKASTQSRSHVQPHSHNTHTAGTAHAHNIATVPRFDLNPNAPEFVPQWSKPKSTSKGKKHPPPHAHTHTHAHVLRVTSEGKDMNARKSGELDVSAREMAL